MRDAKIGSTILPDQLVGEHVMNVLLGIRAKLVPHHLMTADIKKMGLSKNGI